MARTSKTTGSTSRMSAAKDEINETIRKKAYELYEKRGRKPGRSMDDWLEAERIVRQKSL